MIRSNNINEYQKEVKEGFEKSHAEKNVPKRRGRKQRLTDKSVSKSPEDTRDDASGHSDDVGDICVVFDIGDDSVRWFAAFDIFNLLTLHIRKETLKWHEFVTSPLTLQEFEAS